MELGISESAISSKQAHSFAVLMVKDIKNYIKEHTFEFIAWLLEDISSNIIQTIYGIVTRPNITYKYKLLAYK